MGKRNLRNDRENRSKSSIIPSSNSNGSQNNKEYNSTPSDRFYTLKEEVTLRFYQTPKALFKNPKYKGLSLGAKLMYSILRDRLDLSIKHNWKDKKGYIYLMFSGEEILNLLEISKNTVTKYKKELVKYRLIIDKRLGQGKSNRLYVLKPEIKEFQNPNKWESRIPKNTLLESQKISPNDTYTRKTNLNNVNRACSKGVVENSKKAIEEKTLENEEDINDIRRKIKESLKVKGKCSFVKPKDSGNDKSIDEEGKYSNSTAERKSHKSDMHRSREKELLAREIAEELNDDHSLGAFRAIADKIPEQKIRILLSIIKDTYLTGKIKKSRGAMFISLAKEYAAKNNINLNFR
jgi:hypothetical protein